MPRANRQRGKKHKAAPQPEAEEPQQEHYEHEQPPQEDHDAASARLSDAPFGFLDPDVKAYFRTVDSQLKEWQESYGDVEDASDQKEERRNFLVAALSEMAGKELQLATDPDCAAIVERMLHSMDDFLKRVFVDRLSGSFEQLMTHRFASHVCQTIFSIAGATIARETSGILPQRDDADQLRTLTALVLDACDEISQHCSAFIAHPFASHVLRAIFITLCPSIAPDDAEKNLRSKKSATFRAKQGPMKSIFVGEREVDPSIRPKQFSKTAKKLLHSIKSSLGENEIRALVADKAGSPTLQLVVELEAYLGESNVPNSIMDYLLVGLVSTTLASPEADVEPSDYLTTILYDTTSSRLLETLVLRAPDSVFRAFWRCYFSGPGRLQKLAVHAVANFVVAKCTERLTSEEMGAALNDLGGTWEKMRKHGRFGVLKAFIDRSCALVEHAPAVVEATCLTFDITTSEGRSLAVPCILRQKTASEYRAAHSTSPSAADTDDRPSKRRKQDGDAMEPKIQGALVLQSLLHLPAPHHDLVVDSLLAQSPEELLALAHHPISSRVLDEAFAPSMPPRIRKSLVTKFIGHFHTLADDRIGSRVAERAWAASDTYLKEKVARSLIQYDSFLTGSHFGRFFARAINLSLLQRKPEEWRVAQTRARQQQLAPHAPPQKTLAAPGETAAKSQKRKRKHEADEIDELFAIGGKTKPANAVVAAEPKVVAVDVKADDVVGVGDTDDKPRKKSKKRKEEAEEEEGVMKASVSLDASVMQAIRAAPHDEGKKGKRKR